MSQEQKPTKAEGLHAFTELFRALARPAVTIIFAAVIAQVVIQGIDAPHWFIALSVSVISYWFVDRTVARSRK